ncbi:OmpA family protein [Testudinibacter sp. P80/BLE/0925]|uniref:OmpA family protein n=1 Tax=Testudinibacter sp. TW-1 TaxID=3417757 RepID=UPI003D363C78
MEQWENYQSVDINTQDIPLGQTQLVFYRQQQLNGPAINIYIDGNYQTSLLENGFSAILLCAEPHLVSASFSSDTMAGNRTEGFKFASPSQQVTYIKIKNSKSGLPRFEFVATETALKDLSALNMQSQTLSRVPASRCQDDSYILAATSVNAEITFPLNQYAYDKVLIDGQQNIRRFAEKINAMDPKDIGQIVVSGHADPRGRADYNQLLSEKRAKSISNILTEYAVALPIVAVGYGETSLLVEDCALLYPHDIAAQTQCNLPNRRVDIVVYGRKK